MAERTEPRWVYHVVYQGNTEFGATATGTIIMRSTEPVDTEERFWALVEQVKQEIADIIPKPIILNLILIEQPKESA